MMRIFERETLAFIREQIARLPDDVETVTPVEYNEANRYLPESVSSLAGYIDICGVTPYWREIIDAFDINSSVREVNVKKAAQVGWSTALESIILYYGGSIRTLPMMIISADKELVDSRVQNNILPMIVQSNLTHIIQTSDIGNKRKTGKSGDAIQFRGGAVLHFYGARSTAKMRTFSIAVMLKDELDGWADVIGKQGDPDALTDDRCTAYWRSRKIGRGSTPLLKGTSKIERQYKRGDQRVYRVLCRGCEYPQVLRWEWIDKETGEVTGGFKWDYNEDGSLAMDSVRYLCRACQREHFEYEKASLIASESGAHWHATATPVEPGIRSYHLPAFYSPLSPWSASVSAWLEAFDHKTRRVKNVGALQRFYNNRLGVVFEAGGVRLALKDVTGHRRTAYRRGEIPNKYAVKHSGSRILFIACAVDVHDSFLAVGIFGFCRDMRTYLVDYHRLEPQPGETSKTCIQADCSVWRRLAEIIDDRKYIADDGVTYRLNLTVIDSGYQSALVTNFCAQWSAGVIPVVGRKEVSKYQTMLEFKEYQTKAGTVGFSINVNRIKERLSPVLRTAWREGSEIQPEYHFNAPIDIKDSELSELTTETREKMRDPKTGDEYYVWKRRGPNELWDLIIYASAACEIMSYGICRVEFELDSVDWPRYWDFVEGGGTNFFELPEGERARIDAEAAAASAVAKG